LDLVHKAALFGAADEKASYIEILRLFDVEPPMEMLLAPGVARRLREREIIKMVEKPEERILKLKEYDFNFLKVSVQRRKEMVTSIPRLSREQGIIFMAVLLEGFVQGVLETLFTSLPDALKSKKSTLKDEQLVEAIVNGNALDVLINHRIRQLMSESSDS